MKNWKTTLMGWLAGALLAIDPLITAYAAGTFDGKTGKQLAVAIAVVLLGIFAGDKKKPTTFADDSDPKDGAVLPGKGL